MYQRMGEQVIAFNQETERNILFLRSFQEVQTALRNKPICNVVCLGSSYSQRALNYFIATSTTVLNACLFTSHSHRLRVF